MRGEAQEERTSWEGDSEAVYCLLPEEAFAYGDFGELVTNCS